jgi:hypothetical protein
VTGNTFTINLDVRTLFTAMTVTLEVNGPNTLKQGDLPEGTRHASDLAHAVDQILTQAV